MRLRVKARTLDLVDVKTQITEAYQVAAEFEQASGRPDPMKPTLEVRAGVDHVQGWLDLFRSEAEPMWPKLLGAMPDQARAHDVIAIQAALGCFAVIMAAWIRPPRHKLIGEVVGRALNREAFDARVVARHYRNFLVARGTAT
jgi:hypothetical protein